MDEIVVIPVFGHYRIESRPIFLADRMGMEHRVLRYDIEGRLEEIGDWEPPACWLVHDQPDRAERSWWQKLLGIGIV